MGHLVCMDDDPAELALSAWSLESWRKLTPRMPESCAWRGCGTLWLAETPQELALAEEKKQRMAQYQVVSEMQTRDRLAAREPLLTAGLAGGLWVPGDGIVYAPNVARWFINDADLTHLRDSALTVDAPYVTLHSGKRLRARASSSPAVWVRTRCWVKTGSDPKKASWRLPTATALAQPPVGRVGIRCQRPCRRHLSGI